MIEWFVGKGFFRNENHAIWFFLSLGFLMLAIIDIFVPKLTVVLLIIPLVAHIPPLITSIYKTSRKAESTLYSKDCIWFNALMVFIYMALFFVVQSKF